MVFKSNYSIQAKWFTQQNFLIYPATIIHCTEYATLLDSGTEQSSNNMCKVNGDKTREKTEEKGN